jgi:glycosyltransferase involved in cell wall biosynthesis
MNNLHPSVVIGMPIFNGGAYLQQSLESLVQQDYPFLKIFISDNASTDNTPQIVRHYADRDPRIVFHRMQYNVGALDNFRFVLRETKSDFFMWAAHDDIWPEGFVAAAAHCLANDYSAVMVNSTTQLIDESGEDLPAWPSRPQLIDLEGLTYAARIKAIAERVGWCIYGLIKREALLATSVFTDNSPTQDVLLTYELAAMGTFRVLQSIKPFKYRLVPKTQDMVASNLGIQKFEQDKVMTNMFKQCAKAIRESGKDAEEIEEASRLFIDACANHPEWWPYIAKEKGIIADTKQLTSAKSILRDLAVA